MVSRQRNQKIKRRERYIAQREMNGQEEGGLVDGLVSGNDSRVAVLTQDGGDDDGMVVEDVEAPVICHGSNDEGGLINGNHNPGTVRSEEVCVDCQSLVTVLNQEDGLCDRLDVDDVDALVICQGSNDEGELINGNHNQFSVRSQEDCDDCQSSLRANKPISLSSKQNEISNSNLTTVSEYNSSRPISSESSKQNEISNSNLTTVSEYNSSRPISSESSKQIEISNSNFTTVSKYNSSKSNSSESSKQIEIANSKLTTVSKYDSSNSIWCFGPLAFLQVNWSMLFV
jgi:hypothetical protein